MLVNRSVRRTSSAGGARRAARWRLPASLAVGALVAVPGVALLDSAAQSSASQVTTLQIGIGSTTLPNPATSTTDTDFASIQFSVAYEPIFHKAVSGAIEPALATSWQYLNSSPATRNEVFEFTLRSGAAFSDGSAVTAANVAAWLEYFVHSTGPWKGVLGTNPVITATGPLTVRIQMTSPNPDLPQLLSDGGPNIGWVVGPKALADPNLLNSETDGAGQYMLVPSQTLSGDHYTYVPNPYFFDKAAIKFKEVYIKVIADPSSRLEAQETGQLNVEIGDATTAAAATSAGLQVLSAPDGVMFLTLDTEHHLSPPLQNLKVRQALNYAIDRPAIAKALFGSLGVPSSVFITSDLGAVNANYYSYDPAKAKALLAAAGYSKGFSLTALTQGTYFGNFGEPLVQAVAQYLQTLNIGLTITSYPTDPIYATHVFDFQAPLNNLADGDEVTPLAFSTYVAPGAVANFAGTNATLDRLYSEGARSTNPDKYWSEMWKQYSIDADQLPTVVLPNIYYVSKGIGGVVANDLHNSALVPEFYPTGS